MLNVVDQNCETGAPPPKKYSAMHGKETCLRDGTFASEGAGLIFSRTEALAVSEVERVHKGVVLYLPICLCRGCSCSEKYTPHQRVAAKCPEGAK